MNNLEKQERINQLRKENYLSDQEDLELNQLLEELRLTRKDNTTQPQQQPTQNPGVNKPKKQKRSLLQILLEKREKVPATFKEIEQLRLEKQKATLQRDIAKAQHEIKELKPSLWRSLTSTPRQTRQSKKKASRKNNPDFWAGTRKQDIDVKKLFWGDS